MKKVIYSDPFIPAEFIYAYGLKPSRIAPSQNIAGSLDIREGICPYISSFISYIKSEDADAIIVTTLCDQMRRCSELIKNETETPIFLFNLPSTWQTKTALDIYTYELKRLGRFLLKIGGEEPTSDELTDIMKKFDNSRSILRSLWNRISPRIYAKTILRFYEHGEPDFKIPTSPPDDKGISLALIGGPLPESELDLFDIIEENDGKVILNGTENGERTFPAPFDYNQIHLDPLRELVKAYFGSIPDVSRRPNTSLYDWLKREIYERGVRGIIVRYYTWCDLWHGEIQRLKELCYRPVISINADSVYPGVIERTRTRIEAFIEQLK